MEIQIVLFKALSSQRLVASLFLCQNALIGMNVIKQVANDEFLRSTNELPDVDGAFTLVATQLDNVSGHSRFILIAQKPREEEYVHPMKPTGDGPERSMCGVYARC